MMIKEERWKKDGRGAGRGVEEDEEEGRDKL